MLMDLKDGQAITTSTAPCERPSAETLFELICTWFHKGNYCESAAEHDHQETKGPIGRLTKINLHRLYGCQSNVVYGRSQLIDGLPPQVLCLILKILNYLTTNHLCVADILFYFNFTRGLESLNTGIFDMNDKGKEKVLEGEEIPQPDELSIECIVHEALESPQYQSSVAGMRKREYPVMPSEPEEEYKEIGVALKRMGPVNGRILVFRPACGYRDRRFEVWGAERIWGFPRRLVAGGNFPRRLVAGETSLENARKGFLPQRQSPAKRWVTRIFQSRIKCHGGTFSPATCRRGN
uniref:E3 ubiquitin-protein ligase UPL1-like n=1 Tax=Tanacetum cinerariifolium TaxID=118510 RepID=A0A699IPU0_TANCI|nr:E3 ubiquitin-protein ligase UPL1-like [Tanacetum cinerariifolium]